MMQTGLFDWQKRFEQLDQCGDALAKLNRIMDWEMFRADLESLHHKPRRSAAGRKPFDVILMFKVLILQSLYNLSDDATEFQLRDRLTFMRFLGVSLGDPLPDAKTIWLFRERLTKAQLVKPLFERFDTFLREHGFAARGGQIVDASIVPVPRPRAGGAATGGEERHESSRQADNPASSRQKDTDARWTKKRGVSQFGYKNHVQVDVEHKLIRDYTVTDAATHDSQVIEQVLDDQNSHPEVYGDSAYQSSEIERRLAQRGLVSRIQQRGLRNKPLTEQQKQTNRRLAKIRCRVEHVFGVQAQRAGCLLIRTIGIVRATVKVGLRNLAYNIDRFCLLAGA